jgi:hypothetical protein
LVILYTGTSLIDYINQVLPNRQKPDFHLAFRRAYKYQVLFRTNACHCTRPQTSLQVQWTSLPSNIRPNKILRECHPAPDAGCTSASPQKLPLDLFESLRNNIFILWKITATVRTYHEVHSLFACSHGWRCVWNSPRSGSPGCDNHRRLLFRRGYRGTVRRVLWVLTSPILDDWV